MKEIIKYFDSLQMVVNILSFEEYSDIESVEQGLAKSFDLLYSLSSERLFGESSNTERLKSLININRIISKNNDRMSFMEVEQSKIEEWIERLVNAYPIYKEFHQVCESGGVLKINGKVSLTDAFIIPEFFIEKKTELLSLLAAYDITLSESNKGEEGFNLPPELNTDRVKKYFGRAVEVGYMESTATGYKWEFGGKRGSLARLGYFLYKTLCPTNTEQIPQQVVNRLFGVNRIDSAIAQVHNAKTPQKWRAEIDKLFYYCPLNRKQVSPTS